MLDGFEDFVYAEGGTAQYGSDVEQVTVAYVILKASPQTRKNLRLPIGGFYKLGKLPLWPNLPTSLD